jgi:hypothetical protein
MSRVLATLSALIAALPGLALPRNRCSTRGFAGEAGGHQVVIFVAKEGPYQGRVLSALVPDAGQMVKWGLP